MSVGNPIVRDSEAAWFASIGMCSVLDIYSILSARTGRFQNAENGVG
jgi:hypothetical protein